MTDIVEKLREWAGRIFPSASGHRLLLRSAADEIERLRTALAERGEPVAWMTLDDDGSPSMLFFDRAEALTYCDCDEEPTPLYAKEVTR